MPTPATSVEMFEVIARSGLLPPAMVSGYAAHFEKSAPSAGPHTLLTRLLQDGVITQFHARFLATGRYKGFFLGGKYKLLEHLGSGGMGEVYLGEQLLLHRLVAIKLLKVSKETGDNSGAAQRFFREARAAATLRHPNIAQLFDVDSSGPSPYMVMEYLDGTNLHAVVAEHGRLSIPRAVNYTVQAARGLGHAHAAGLVHRDVKPGNLMLDRGGTVKVLDLGLARYFSDTAKNKNLTATYDENMLIGTADFIAPEQTQDSSAVDQRVDLYSLGCTLYFFLTGRGPFDEGTVAQKLLWHQLKPPTPVNTLRTDIPAGLVTVLDRMMAKDRDQRYAAAADVEVALAPWFDPDLPPPPEHEMPRVRADEYRIGLVEAVPQFDLAGTNTTATAAAPTTPPQPRSGSVVDISAPPIPVPEWMSAAGRRPTGPATRRRRSFGSMVLFIAVQLSLLAITVVVTLALYKFANHEPNRSPLTRKQPDAAPPLPPMPAGGSTLVEPLMKQWLFDYPSDRRSFAYTANGSGDGVQGLLDERYRLAFTDTPADDAALQTARERGKSLSQVPVVLSAVVPVYHLPDVPNGLLLDGPTLADIYLGRISHWDDPAILRLNAKEAERFKLPHLPIKPVYRSTASGTTAIWTDFLAHTSPAWAKRYGLVVNFDPPVDVPEAIPASKNKDVASVVARTEGAIGYLELATARDAALKEARVQNAAGRYPLPEPRAVVAAARQFDPSAPATTSIVFAAGEDAYPIAGFTWAVFDTAADATEVRDTIDFLLWVTGVGQQQAEPRHYVPLPQEVGVRVRADLERIQNRLSNR